MKRRVMFIAGFTEETPNGWGASDSFRQIQIFNKYEEAEEFILKSEVERAMEIRKVYIPETMFTNT